MTLRLGVKDDDVSHVSLVSSLRRTWYLILSHKTQHHLTVTVLQLLLCMYTARIRYFYIVRIMSDGLTDDIVSLMRSLRSAQA